MNLFRERRNLGHQAVALLLTPTRFELEHEIQKLLLLSHALTLAASDSAS
jgi:hypothetical protein